MDKTEPTIGILFVGIRITDVGIGILKYRAVPAVFGIPNHH